MVRKLKPKRETMKGVVFTKMFSVSRKINHSFKHFPMLYEEPCDILKCVNETF